MLKPASELPDTQVEADPNPKLERRTRRTFRLDYKLRILAEADACKHGELRVLLRWENLYSNQLAA